MMAASSKAIYVVAKYQWRKWKISEKHRRRYKWSVFSRRMLAAHNGESVASRAKAAKSE